VCVWATGARVGRSLADITQGRAGCHTIVTVAPAAAAAAAAATEQHAASSQRRRRRNIPMQPNRRQV